MGAMSTVLLALLSDRHAGTSWVVAGDVPPVVGWTWGDRLVPVRR